VSTPLAALHLADGPAMYFGGTIMTFALPLGAFIVISTVLFYLFRSAHSGPRLKYLTAAPFASVGTREPGPPPASVTVSANVAHAVEDPESPIVTEATADPATLASPHTIVVSEETAAPETAEGKDGEA
jgi:hypothetical protein